MFCMVRALIDKGLSKHEPYKTPTRLKEVGWILLFSYSKICWYVPTNFTYLIFFFLVALTINYNKLIWSLDIESGNIEKDSVTIKD